jgi:hypothetical protein
MSKSIKASRTTKAAKCLLSAHDELSNARDSLLLALQNADALIDLSLSPIIGDCANLLNRVNALMTAVKSRDTEF